MCMLASVICDGLLFVWKQCPDSQRKPQHSLSPESESGPSVQTMTQPEIFTSYQI